MTFLAPGWLVVLLLAAPILLLHMRRRRRVQVSSLLLWQGVAGAPLRSQALRKPPVSVALLLQLLAVLLAAVLLARPVPASYSAEHLILMLDAGANQDGARFAASTNEARRLLAAAATQDGATWSLLLVTDRPRPLAAQWPAESANLADLETELRPSSGAANWPQAALLARRLSEDEALGPGGSSLHKPARVVVIGPSAAGLEQVRALLPAAEFVPVSGGPSEVFASATVKPTATAGQVRVSGELVGLAVTDGDSRTVALDVSFTPASGGAGQGASVDVTMGDLAAGGSAGAFDLTAAVESGGLLNLAVGESEASFVLHDQPVSMRVLYLGPGDEQLQRALAALPHVMVERLPATAELPDDASDYHLVIIDRVTVDEAPATSTWWLGSAHIGSEDVPVKLEHESVTLWADHGPGAEVDWSAIRLGAAWSADELPGASILVSGEAGPIMQLRHGVSGLELRSSFELSASDWPDRNSFPLFIRNLVALVEPAAGLVIEDSCQVGMKCRLPAGTTAITTPNGADLPLARWEYEDARLVASEFNPERTGVHLLSDARGRQRQLAVNAFQSSLAQPLAEASATGGGTDRPLNLRRALLVLLALVIAAEAYFAKRTSGAYGARLLAARAAVLVLVGLAAFELRLPLPSHAGQLVVVQPSGEQARIGDDELVSLAATQVLTDPRFTDLEASLDLAAALVTPGTPARLVITGDGSETRGDLAAAAARLSGRSLTFDAFTHEQQRGLDVLVRALTTPATILAGDRFQLNAVVHATAATAATVTTFRDGEQLDERDLTLQLGDNRVSAEFTERYPGSFRYELQVSAPGDDTAANDRHGVQVNVAPGVQALLVAESLEWARLLTAAFEAQGIDVKTVTPGAFTSTMEELQQYGAVMLMNVPAVALSLEQQLLLEEAVQELGLALLLLGGENAFGPGGYYETPLERLSPTSSLVPRETPELAIAFVLDRSNSMRQYAGDAVRLDIAKVAALQSHDLLPEGARSTLIVFDSNARTLVPLGPAADDAAFRAAIEALEPRGGTNLYPALVEAYEQLADAGAAAAHVIVMSDGLSLPGDFEGIVGLLREKNITVSTIAIGPEADADQLREVARLGGGTFHASVDFGALPSIMAHEVLLQSGELTEERNTTPAWHGPRPPFLRAWPDELPPVSGFVPTSVKPAATLHLSVTNERGEAMPLLSSWHHGAGQVVAFTAHGAGPWTSAWLAEGAYPQMWSHLVRQIAREPSDTEGAIKLTRRGDELMVSSGVANLLLEHDGDAKPLNTHEVSDGRYLSTAILEQLGWYEVNPDLAHGDSRTRDDADGYRAALHFPYPAVLDPGLANPAKLEAVARASGGKALTDLGQLGPVARWHWARLQAWPLLITAALLLLLLELTCRYAPTLFARRTRKDRS